jgi:DNA-binding IclR family transcriptional regulator
VSVPRTQSLARAIALLRVLEHHPRGISTAEMARTADLAPATAGRLLATLHDAGFVERTSAGWIIGNDLVRLTQRANPDRALIRRAQPLLEDLAATAGESAMLGVPRSGPSLEVIAQADGPRLLGLTSWVGRAIELHASAAGKLVLAELSESALDAWIRRERPRRLTDRTIVGRAALRAEIARARQRGWAELDGESEIGLSSIAVAVREADGSLGAILGYSGPTERLDRAALLAPLLCAADRLH